MQLKLNPVKSVPGGNRFCGPAVVSSILNVDTKTSAFLLRHRNNRRQITGTAPEWIANVLKDCGIAMRMVEQYPKAQAPTLNQWLGMTLGKRLDTGNLYLLVAGNHWQLIQDMRYVCGIIKEVVSVDHPKVKRRARVTKVYLIQHEEA